MFDVVWLDDCFLVSGSRDTTMALWKLEERLVNRERQHEDQPCNLRPLSVKLCRTAEKVRALAFNKRDMEVAALSLNGYIHTWKAEIFKQVTKPSFPGCCFFVRSSNSSTITSWI